MREKIINLPGFVLKCHLYFETTIVNVIIVLFHYSCMLLVFCCCCILLVEIKQKIAKSNKCIVDLKYKLSTSKDDGVPLDSEVGLFGNRGTDEPCNETNPKISDFIFTNPTKVNNKVHCKIDYIYYSCI